MRCTLPVNRNRLMTMQSPSPLRAMIACLLGVSVVVAILACKPGGNAADLTGAGGAGPGSGDTLVSADAEANTQNAAGIDPADGSNAASNAASNTASNAASNAASSGPNAPANAVASANNTATSNTAGGDADLGNDDDADGGDNTDNGDGGPRTVPIQDPPADTEGVVARVSFSSGRNLVYRSDESIERAEVDMALGEGDRIEVSSRGKLTLVYAETGLFQPVGAGETVTITAAINNSDQARDMDRVNEYLVETLIEGEGGSTLAAVGGTRTRRDPRRPFPLSPRNSAVLAGAVTFAWQAPDLVDREPFAYRLRILREGRVIHDIETLGTVVTIQPATLRFEADTLYMWYVTLVDDLEEPAFKPCFQPLSEADGQALRAQLEANGALISDAADGTAHMLNGLALERALAFNAALDEYIEAYKLAPGDAGTIGRLRRVYRAMNWVTDDASTALADLAEQHPAEDE